ncbi:MAG: hypothetical protein HGA87_01535 [Desulfobulbaceae bacterium]|nr:hypothetical protein [Desulfobulbaceae bacterium]
MSREIEFEAWHERTKRMYRWPDILGHYTARSLFIEAEKFGLKLREYTGLKDKNGKKIFEGDIVRWSDGYAINDRDETVVFEDGAFLSAKNYFRTALAPHASEGATTKTMRVIGNIYEHPELLK